MASASTPYTSMNDIEKLSSIVVTGLSVLVKTTANIGSSDTAGFLQVACAVTQKLIEHGEAVGENDLCVKEAGRRGAMVQTTLNALAEAQFPSTHLAFSTILETLAELNAIAEKWGDKGYWTKRLGVSFSKGTTKALKYKQLFELQFQVGFTIQIMIAIRNIFTSFIASNLYRLFFSLSD